MADWRAPCGRRRPDGQNHRAMGGWARQPRIAELRRLAKCSMSTPPLALDDALRPTLSGSVALPTEW